MRTVIIGVACVAIGIAADALFLPHQSLWNDEATQMSGLSLDPVEVTKWLADRVDYDFGVPDDRMPPLSYWAGWIWSRVTGLSETPMRWLGVACVAIATAVVFAAANRAWGLTAGAAASLLLATSPNVVMISVEIRAYPMLILAAAGIYACLIGYATSSSASRRRWLAGMVACGIAAMYTHFFGLVALGGALVAAFVLARANGESVRPVVVAGGVAAVAVLGLAPFVFASTSLSQGNARPAEVKLVGLVRLAYRQFSHPAMSISPVAVGLAALGFVLGVVSGLAPKARWTWAARGLGLALASGGAVVAVAQLAQSTFEAAQQSYNVWMLPPLAILMGSGLAARAWAVRNTAIAAILLSLATNLYADAHLALRGANFAHTAHRPIADAIRRLGSREVALIHDGDTAQAWHIYSPIRYEFGGQIRQFSLVAGGQTEAAIRVTDYPLPRKKVEYDPITLPFHNLIVVRSAQWHAKDIASQIRRGIVPLGDGPVTHALLASGGWERVEEGTYLAFVGADVDILRKVYRH
jgi:4-amino-4-deoxy-L-arabinose transferase-like glycosyltransferase